MGCSGSHDKHHFLLILLPFKRTQCRPGVKKIKSIHRPSAPSSAPPLYHPGCSWTAHSDFAATCSPPGPRQLGWGDGRSPWGCMLQADPHHQDTCNFLLAGLILCICPCVLWLPKPLLTNPGQGRTGIPTTCDSPKPAMSPVPAFPCKKVVQRNVKSWIGHRMTGRAGPAHVQLLSLFTIFVTWGKSHTLCETQCTHFLKEDNDYHYQN